MTCMRTANMTIVVRSSMKNIFAIPSADSVKLTAGLHSGCCFLALAWASWGKNLIYSLNNLQVLYSYTCYLFSGTDKELM